MNLPVDFEPSHPKMGFLINELAREAARIIEKRSGERSSEAVKNASKQ